MDPIQRSKPSRFAGRLKAVWRVLCAPAPRASFELSTSAGPVDVSHVGATMDEPEIRLYVRASGAHMALQGPDALILASDTPSTENAVCPYDSECRLFVRRAVSGRMLLTIPGHHPGEIALSAEESARLRRFVREAFHLKN